MFMDQDEFIRISSHTNQLANLRKTQTEGPKLPAGTVVVSADGHLALAEDIFYGNFPEHLKDQAPRIWFDEATQFFHMGLGHESFYPEAFHGIVRSIEQRESTTDQNARIRDMDDEGVDKEIVFPNTISMYFGWPNHEVRENVFRIYNEYVAGIQSRYPTRLFPVPFVNYWDPAKAESSIRSVVDLGMKTYMIPMKPGKNLAGEQLFYGAPEMDRLWSVAEEAGLPVCFHIGESFDHQGPAGTIVEAMHQLGGGAGLFRKLLAELMFSGVFDRHPKLQIVFAEGGIHWAAGALQDFEMGIDSYSGLLDYMPRERPSTYWHRNCFASFMNDALGLRQLDVLGADRVLWSSDYPHNEGTIGYTRDSMNYVVEATSQDDARKILGGTALKLFSLD